MVLCACLGNKIYAIVVNNVGYRFFWLFEEMMQNRSQSPYSFSCFLLLVHSVVGFLLIFFIYPVFCLFLTMQL